VSLNFYLIKVQCRAVK